MTINEWIVSILGEFPEEFQFILCITSSILLVIATVLIISMFFGIAFAIFKRN